MSTKNDLLNIALRYYDYGIQLIPIHASSVNGKGKAPILEGWTSFGYEKKTEQDIINAFNSRKDVIGIGLPFGDANNLCAIDVDDCSTAIRDRLPASLVRRQGRPGREMRFFLKTPGLISRKYKNIGIEIFATSGQVLLPPSRHIEASVDYMWITNDVLPDNLDALYPLTPSMIAFLETHDQEMPVVTNLSGGRNNRLLGIAVAMLSRGITDVSLIAKELYNEDLKHDKPLFSDSSEGYTGDANNNAFKFSLSVMQTQFRRGAIETNSIPTIKITSDPKPSTKSTYPILKNSIISTFVEYQRLMTGTEDTDALAIGGAVSLVSYLAGNKFKTTSINGYDVRPNLYCLNIAPSGAGKSTPQSLIADNLRHDNCVSTEQFKSCQAFLTDIAKQQTRLHVIDEASFLLNAMAHPESYQADLVSSFLQLFSLSSSRFQGISSKASGKRFGAVNNPSITVLASCTPVHLKNKFNQEMIQGGLFPRFLFFNVDEVKSELNIIEAKKKEQLISQIKKFVNSFESIPRKAIDSNSIDLDCGDWYKLKDIFIDNSCNQIIKDFFKYSQSNTNTMLKEFYSRSNELTSKLALIACLSQGASVVMPEHYNFAIETFEASIENVTPYISEGMCGNDYARLKNKILQIVLTKGTIEKHMISKLTNENSLRMPINKQVRDSAINDLIEEGSISLVKNDTGGLLLTTTTSQDVGHVGQCRATCRASVNITQLTR